LSAFYFDRLIADQRQWDAHQWQSAESTSMDLSGGFECYLQRRANPRSKIVRKTMQKYRKLEREVGPVRLDTNSTDKNVFHQLIAWKSDQYRRTRTGNVLAWDWTVPLLEHVLEQQQPHFCGMQSVLYAGDAVAAVQVGMLSRGVLHYWFIAHNPALAGYSPGALLLMSLAQAADNLGIRRIDLGQGDETFKSRYKTGGTAVVGGAVDLRPLVLPIRRFWLQAQDWVRQSRWEMPARFLLRHTQAVFGRGTA
jgi:CelD/BcsL family acetyltransferase involved in cellulose biosynthesis